MARMHAPGLNKTCSTYFCTAVSCTPVAEQTETQRREQPLHWNCKARSPQSSRCTCDPLDVLSRLDKSQHDRVTVEMIWSNVRPSIDVTAVSDSKMSKYCLANATSLR